MFKKTTYIKNDASNDVLFYKQTIDETVKKSQILVGPTDVAFIEKDGMLLDVLEEGIHDVFDKKSKLFPFFQDKKCKTGIDVIYMNKTLRSQILWGTPNYINAVDPHYTVPVEIGSSGELEIQINNPRKFYLELVGRDNEFTIKDLKKRLTQKIISQLEPNIITSLHDMDVSSEHLLLTKQAVEDNINEKLKTNFYKNYGINLVSFSISKMFITEQSVNNISNAKDKELRQENGIFDTVEVSNTEEVLVETESLVYNEVTVTDEETVNNEDVIQEEVVYTDDNVPSDTNEDLDQEETEEERVLLET